MMRPVSISCQKLRGKEGGKKSVLTSFLIKNTKTNPFEYECKEMFKRKAATREYIILRPIRSNFKAQASKRKSG